MQLAWSHSAAWAKALAPALDSEPGLGIRWGPKRETQVPALLCPTRGGTDMLQNSLELGKTSPSRGCASPCLQCLRPWLGLGG